MGGTDLFEIGDLTYNAEGQLIQEVGQSIWGGGSPENSWMIDYEYNTDGTLNTSKHYFWNGHSWDYASGEWFDYDENKNCIKWDHKSGNTVVNRNEYAYNMDVSQENVILPINPENLNGEHLVEMENKLIQKTWSTMDNISGGLVYICDYFYEYETIPGLGIPSSEMVVDNITLFPSPANEVVTVLAKNLFINQIEVMDVSGKQVLLESNANQRQSKLNVSHLKSGVYFVRVSTNRGSVTQKLIVQ